MVLTNLESRSNLFISTGIFCTIRPRQYSSVFNVRFYSKLGHEANKQKVKKNHFLCHFKIQMLFDAKPRIKKNCIQNTLWILALKLLVVIHY